jgi:hypothetical protein
MSREQAWVDAFLHNTTHERTTKGVMPDMIFKNSLRYANDFLIEFDNTFKKEEQK